MKPLIYISGPYSAGDISSNVRNAISAGDYLISKGFLAYVPHLSHFWHIMSPKPYSYWIELDLRIIPVCTALLRIPGYSAGADKEVSLAVSLGKPIYYERFTLAEHYDRLCAH